MSSQAAIGITGRSGMRPNIRRSAALTWNPKAVIAKRPRARLFASFKERALPVSMPSDRDGRR